MFVPVRYDCHTCILFQATSIFQIEIWQCAVNVGAYFLPRLRGTEDADDRDRRRVLPLRRAGSSPEERIELGRHRLVVIDAVQAEAERVHEGTDAGWPSTCCM